MISYRSYHKEPVNLTRPLAHEFAGMTTAELLAWDEHYGRERTETLDGMRSDASVKSNLAFVDLYQDRVRAELKRRKSQAERHRNDPRAPRWPHRRDYEDLVQLAQNLKREIPLERFVADQVLTTHLERIGNHWKGTCPIPTHDDRSPSFVVWPDGGWKCFGQCNRGGDIYILIALVFGIERFPDQVRFLAEFYEQIEESA